MGLSSMTGYADLTGAAGAVSWTWEARSVNGRGLDLRLRLPEGFEPLEPRIRAAFGAALARGSVTVTLRIARAPGVPSARLNRPALDAALMAASEVSDAAAARGLVTAPLGLGEILGLRGVLEAESAVPADMAPLIEAIDAGIDRLAAALAETRAAEGAGLERLIAARVDDIDAQITAARQTAEARAARTGELLRQRVTALLDAADGLDPARLAQELALIAVKTDVSEELDRLAAHVGAARDLLGGNGPAGRKLDFLTQEFNREANTLCSKANDADLTAIGLGMKISIDQMREQVQNVE